MGTATEKQLSFLTRLADERDLGTQADALALHLKTRDLDSRNASRWIELALASPRKAQAERVSPWAEANAALADVETSFYAIPAGYVSAQRIDLYGNDYLFVRVRNYQGKRYLSRVHGSPSGPRYTRIDPRTVVSLAAVMRGRHVEFAALWHEHSGRCGRCNALLTDQESRAHGLGPDCRKVWGL